MNSWNYGSMKDPDTMENAREQTSRQTNCIFGITVVFDQFI